MLIKEIFIVEQKELVESPLTSHSKADYITLAKIILDDWIDQSKNAGRIAELLAVIGKVVTVDQKNHSITIKDRGYNG